MRVEPFNAGIQFAQSFQQTPVRKAYSPMGSDKADNVDIRFGALRAAEKQAQAFVDTHTPQFVELGRTAGYASWDIYTGAGGDAGDRYNAAADKMIDLSNNPQALEEANGLKAQLGKIRSRALRRQVEGLQQTFAEGSVRPDLQKVISNKETELEEVYNSYRAVIDGETLSNVAVNERFRFTADPAEAQAMWEARHAVGNHQEVDEEGKVVGGPTVAERMIELVGLRNQLAREAGYDNFYTMQLATQEVDAALVDQIMDDVTAVTDGPFAKLQAKIDDIVQEHFGVPAKDARLPWFQSLHGLGSNGPSNNMTRLLQYDADTPFKGKDPVPLLEKTAQAMGFSIQDIIDASDLYFDKDRPGKAQHWFCFPLNAPHDVRALENIDPNLQNAMGDAFSTSLHEVLGHGLDYSQIDPELPDSLRDHHTITTESNAMLVQELVDDSRWFHEILGLPKKEAEEIGKKAKNASLAQQLANTRAMLATIDFERSMYALSDEERTMDRLNDLWWEKQERYLGEKKPEGRNNPDWARVPHYTGAPYYYNYFMGEVRRAQVKDYVDTKYGHLLTKRAGAYLRKHRAEGGLYKWDELVERMTGKPLAADALKKELSRLSL